MVPFTYIKRNNSSALPYMNEIQLFNGVINGVSITIVRHVVSVGVTIKAVQSDDKIRVSMTWRESVLYM